MPLSRPLTVDAHVDTLWVMSGLAAQHTPTITKQRMQFGGLDRAVFAIYLSDAVIDGRDQGSVNILVGRAIAAAKEHFPDHYIAVEGARVLGVVDPEHLLRQLAKAGIKYLTLVHNRNNIFCTSATDVSEVVGLTKYGSRLMSVCEEEGVLVDVSHASDRTITDVLCRATKPVIASHSGCRKVLVHPRNLTDAQIEGIAMTGGVVGVPFARRFTSSVAGVIDHIDHVCQVTGGVANVAIGSDLDGAVMVTGVRGAEDWSTVVVEGLSRRGYLDEEIAFIAGLNLLRVFGDV